MSAKINLALKKLYEKEFNIPNVPKKLYCKFKDLITDNSKTLENFPPLEALPDQFFICKVEDFFQMSPMPSKDLSDLLTSAKDKFEKTPNQEVSNSEDKMMIHFKDIIDNKKVNTETENQTQLPKFNIMESQT